MRPIRFTTNALVEVLQRRIIATLPELCAALGNCSPSTLFRKLKEIDYLASYSHRGKYYTLRACADFDAQGLWSYNGIYFSRDGTLKNTVKRLVETSPTGYRAVDLDALLGVRTLTTLAKFVRDGQLSRARFEKQTIYCIKDSEDQRRQLLRRKVQQAEETIPDATQATGAPTAALALFWSLLNEKQRRLFAGLTSLLWGYGGDQRAAKVFGLSRKTVRKGRIELSTEDVEPNRVRRSGGGRIPLKKKRPR